ncbi:MAG: hypothetical protein V3W19_01220 [Desulfatiglandales bacterium]
MKQFRKLLALQSSQPLLCILDLSNTRVSIFPEVEEFLVKFDGFSLPAFLLVLTIISKSYLFPFKSL